MGGTMIVECQECGAAVSDSAEVCPRCRCEKRKLVGPAIACAECGSTFHNSYPTCLECGAPKLIANPKGRDGLSRSKSDETISSGIQRSDFVDSSPRSERLKVKRLSTLATMLSASLWAYIAADVALLIFVVGASLIVDDSIGGNPLSEQSRALLDFSVRLSFPATVLWMASLAASAFLYSHFVFRALRNLRKANAPGIETTPVMGVVWSFVPIGSLYAPFMVMTELWRVTRQLIDQEKRVPLAFWIWWLAWLISGVTNIGAFGINLLLSRPETFDVTLITPLTQLSVVSLLTGILSALALLPIIRAIASAHDRSLPIS